MAEPVWYFFGCVGRAGHHYWGPDLRMSRGKVSPWGYEVDGQLAPGGAQAGGDPLPYARREEVEGHAAIHHRSGWTAVSFWDRSVDRRSACNGTFLVDRTMTFEEVMEGARRVFPRVMERFTFPIVLVWLHG